MIHFVTGNADKFREFNAQIPNLKQLKLDLDEIQSLDPQVVIKHKLEQAAQLHPRGALLVEDTSLTAHALRELPGTFIKWFEQSLGLGGIAELVEDYDDNTATARTVIGYRSDTGDVRFFTGEIQGAIVEPRGSGFGWDAIFMPDGYEQTFGQLGPELKQRISMRRRAIDQLARFLSTSNPATP